MQVSSPCLETPPTHPTTTFSSPKTGEISRVPNVESNRFVAKQIKSRPSTAQASSKNNVSSTGRSNKQHQQGMPTNVKPTSKLRQDRNYQPPRRKDPSSRPPSSMVSTREFERSVVDSVAAGAAPPPEPILEVGGDGRASAGDTYDEDDEVSGGEIPELI